MKPHSGALVQIQLSPHDGCETLYCVERNPDLEAETGLMIDSALLKPSRDGVGNVVVTNPTGLPQRVEQGTVLGEAATAVVEELFEPDSFEKDVRAAPDHAEVGCQERQTTTSPPGHLRRIDTHSSQEARKKKLLQLLPKLETLEPGEGLRVCHLLQEHHEAFCLDDNERGETDILQFGIDTGDSPPQNLPARRMPLVVRQEVARQLKDMQRAGVI